MIAGIDEAGYGPFVGPLAVAMSVVRLPVPEGAPGAGVGEPPDLWRALGPKVCRDAKDADRGAVAIDDSKKLKLANTSTKRHPLLHVERGVLAAARVGGLAWSCDRTLMEALGADLSDPVWAAGEAIALPVGSTADHQRLADLHLRSAFGRARASLLELRCLALSEARFNAGVKRAGNKAGLSFEQVAHLVRRVWRSRAAVEDGRPPVVVVDRQGGRAEYAPLLARALDGATIEEVRRAEGCSAYRCVLREGDATRRIDIRFEVEADARCLAVALASMTAKYVRELAMMRFNRYWAGVLPEVKPTAGYGQDGRRWLDEARPHLSDAEYDRVRRVC